jgi:hypothetical protein
MAKEYKNLTDLGGLMTHLPEDKIPDRNASDIANIDLSSPGLIQTRKGFRLFGQDTTGIGNGLRGYLFRKNFGTIKKVKLRVIDDGTNSKMQWHNASNADEDTGKWEDLVTGLTTDKTMGFAPANGNDGNKVNLLIFCNGEENFSTWNGATATVASVTSNTIVTNETLTPDEGFTATGDVIIDGTSYAYTGLSSATFTGVTPDPTTQTPSAGTGIAQKADTTTHSSNEKGNVLLTAQGKLFLSGVSTNESKVHYSTSTDITDFTISSGLGSGGTFDVMEGGGGINLLESKGKNQVIIHKDDSVISYIRDNDGTNAIENFDTLSEGDDTGATNIKAGAVINQESFFATNIEGIKNLKKAIQDASLNLDSITDIILPTVKQYDFSDAAAIFYPEKRAIYVACKSSEDKTFNNKVIALYIRQKIIDISIDNLNVKDWIVSGNDLYYLSSVDQNTYKLFDENSDNETSITHKWVSKEFTFGEPARQKEFNKLYIEGFIKNRTKIKISILYGSLGSKGVKEKIVAWDDNFVSTQKISALGTDVIGTVSLGATSNDIQDSYAFSVPIHFDINRATRYKIKIETEYDDETNVESYWAVSNISTNPTMIGIDHNKTINSNN